jgi:DNA-binding GntR family transcriptional regulator
MICDAQEKQKAGPADVYAFLREAILSKKLAPGTSMLVV